MSAAEVADVVVGVRVEVGVEVAVEDDVEPDVEVGSIRVTRHQSSSSSLGVHRCVGVALGS